MREKQDHEILADLESLVQNSINEYTSLASDIAQAEVWVNDLVDILLGEREKNEHGKVKKNGKRNTEQYKQGTSSAEVEEKFSSYIFSLSKNQKQYSKPVD
jgi:hypothetical protein